MGDIVPVTSTDSRLDTYAPAAQIGYGRNAVMASHDNISNSLLDSVHLFGAGAAPANLRSHFSKGSGYIVANSMQVASENTPLASRNFKRNLSKDT